VSIGGRSVGGGRSIVRTMGIVGSKSDVVGMSGRVVGVAWRAVVQSIGGSIVILNRSSLAVVASMSDTFVVVVVGGSINVVNIHWVMHKSSRILGFIFKKLLDPKFISFGNTLSVHCEKLQR